MEELTKIKGVGEKTLSLLNNINIYNMSDILSYYPYKYNFINIQNIREAKDGDNVIIIGKIEKYPLVRRFGRLNSLLLQVYANNKVVNVNLFNRAFMKNNYAPGSEVTVYGKWDEAKNTITASKVDLGYVKDNTIESVYHLTSGLTNKTLVKLINESMKYSSEVEDYIPEYLNEKYKFISKSDAIIKIHNPADIKDIKQAKLKLIYEELFLFMFKINYLKRQNKVKSSKLIRKVDVKKVDEFIRTLPFELTKDQLTSVKKIYEDLTGDKRMNRMLQGDVGSGKTVVAVISAYINYLSGYQTALMAPTEILATQHYENIKNLFIGTDVRVGLLTGSMKKKDKQLIYLKLITGEIDLLIGTHALISENVKFKNLGLVITDEQHRFGVNQRENLKNKGIMPDILYMSATPIPRTFALTLYGDMDISSIKTKPNGRKEIKTLIRNEKQIKEVLGLMLDEIKKGRQIYVISPLIEDEEGESGLETVTELKEKLDTAFNNKVPMEILHGKMTKEEKEATMNNFKEGKTSVLISTTVIEVGVDVKNATMMVVFNAERFGLSTLHQLRGRIGRNEYDSTCILIGSKSNKRLQVLEESTDGFYITEKDYEMRKEGDLFGIKQSGDMSFKLADIGRDMKVVLQAKEDSEEFLSQMIKNDFKNEEKYYKIIEEIKNLS